MKLVRRIRLSTLLLLIMIVALGFGLLVQRQREAQLLATLALYRDVRQEGIFDLLGGPIPLNYPDGAPLDQVLKEIKLRTTGPSSKLPTGIPIYVDPLGLQEAERSLVSPVKRPSTSEKLSLAEHLRRVLNPLGLGYVVKDGFLMITAKESVDEPLGDDVDPYPQYRDVLR
jgi:hypothetical protein